MVLRELRAFPTPTDIVFLLDISPSMYARDMSPSRLGRAEEIIQKFVLMKQPQDRYGLVVFNWDSAVLSYLTSDPQNLLVYFDYLNQQDQPEPGTNMGAALTAGLRLLGHGGKIQSRAASRAAGPCSSCFPTATTRPSELEKPLHRARKVRHQGLHLRVGHGQRRLRAVGDEGGLAGEVDQYLTMTREASGWSAARKIKTLREIAEKSGASFVRGENDQQVDQAAGRNSDSRPARRRLSLANPVRKDLYRYFLAAAFACLVAGIFL